MKQGQRIRILTTRSLELSYSNVKIELRNHTAIVKRRSRNGTIRVEVQDCNLDGIAACVHLRPGDFEAVKENK